MVARCMLRSTTMWVVLPSFAEEQVVFGSVDSVAEAENGAARLRDVGADDQFVVVAGGRLVACDGLYNGDAAAFFLLHGFVGEAELAHVFDAADFKPDQIVGMVDDAHLVGFGVADANAGL
jgi:hypothetical protein